MISNFLASTVDELQILLGTVQKGYIDGRHRILYSDCIIAPLF